MANKGRPMRRSWLPPVWIATGLLLVVCFLSIAVISRPARPLPLPRTIAGYPLRAHLFGAEAAAEIRRMHKGTFPLTAAAIGVYGNTDAILWVSETWGSIGAWLLEWSMTEAIARQKTPFRPLGVRTVSGIRVHVLSGLGQRHFYFRLGNRVYWLAVNPESADPGLQEIIDFARED